MYDAHRGGAGGEDALEQVFSELDHKEAAAAELRSWPSASGRRSRSSRGGGTRTGPAFLRLFRKGGGKLPFSLLFWRAGCKIPVILAAAALAANRQTVFRARPGRLLQIRRTSFMNYTFAQYQESADYIRSQIGGFAPRWP